MSDKTMNENSNDFKERVEMLAEALSLKGSETDFNIGDNRLLFSTYIKMIESDQDEFFIEKDHKHKIINSLKNTLSVYDSQESESIKNMFEKLKNNDPTDFVLVPVFFFPGDYRKELAHVCGFTVYKKDEQFIVLKVDKQRLFDGYTASYFEIPANNSKELGELFFQERDSWQKAPYYIFNELAKLSTSNKTIPIPAIEMKEQTTTNCGVNEIEASLKTILFNCRTDIFSLDKDTPVTPTWKPKYREAMTEMRRRFLDALKGKNIEQNKNLDHIFHFYLYRKGKLVEKPGFDAALSSSNWYWRIRNLYSEDPYIPIMLDNNGGIPSTYDKFLLEKNSKIIEPPGAWGGQGIQTFDLFDLEGSKAYLTRKIQIYKERLPHINIPIAKEMIEHVATKLEEKKQEIEVELHKRSEIELMKKNEKEKQTVGTVEKAKKVDTEKNSDTVTKETKNERTEEKRSSLKSVREHAVIHAQRLTTINREKMKQTKQPSDQMKNRVTETQQNMLWEDAKNRTTIKPNKMKQSEQVKVNVTEKTESVSWEESKKKNIASCFAFLRSLNPFAKKAEYSYLKLGIPEQESAKKVKFSTLFQRFQTNKKKPDPTSHRISRQQPMNISR
ncbi:MULTISPECIES: hypothetical protein [unclassified Enterococcus]|uniref:hypothetical protein n=1 Tax=unclassified Enterococcus TaxID=2608891 RepID=UPI001A929BF5|nr:MULTISPECIES: hypothetical protein [unclassified Enterococcus]MBO0460530.1 hypothetical protein [Enterococcus sp. DIV1298c]MBO1298562.1 hypothetical protein [Enterococcus sp. DIV1271a]